MPTFETPAPIKVTVEIANGSIRIAAGDRLDTVVDVRPGNADDRSDIEAAAQISVDYIDGELRVAGPRRMLDFARKSRSVHVSIEVPSGSRVAADTWAGDIRCAGPLGDCRLKTGYGTVQTGQTGSANLQTAFGHITAEHIAGDAELATGSGDIEADRIQGAAGVKNSNGGTVIGTVGGAVRVRSANGAITIGRAGGAVDAKTSNGAIRVGEVVAGTAVLTTASGDLDIGIAEGTAAWLDVHTAYGQVHTRLDSAARPEDTDETAEVRARTSAGDITIHRSAGRTS
ncbi:DUF4097 family beta strand repeat-containing protein [Actinoplanes sp. NBRC 101535]|uniref:DUF4097 family beta strand repeat-containing protein n=1 Tax=Actinoplanes sp. NBRC 101535 TaxID=3032196 RepID=UPI00249FEC19|nr:DUF4097 family beta strand repeat-containing protein [Actinoplanes sp. NBRC 101535]GLY04495.1 hypothetical protein Acsp01_48740 [Actinoplanes sp. NBRC 101535]